MTSQGEAEFDRLPKIIWMYWDQGELKAPFLVRSCIDSWRRENPGWDLRVLDDSVWSDFEALSWLREKADIGVQHRSDLLRLHLLMTVGGVWADATLFCNQPLDAWLPDYYQDHFFAFTSTKKDREASNWFLAGCGKSQLLESWHRKVFAFWIASDFPPQGYWRQQLVRKLMSLRKRQWVSNNVWFSNFLLRQIKAYPYPINMYLFDKVLEASDRLREQWRRRIPLSDRDCEYLQNPLGINRPLNNASRIFLERGVAPLYKLNWRQDRGHALPGSNFEFLLRLKQT